MLGAEDYFDWKVRRVEGLDKRLVFAWLHELEAATRTRARESLDELAAGRGHDALSPWSLRCWIGVNLTAEQAQCFRGADATADVSSVGDVAPPPLASAQLGGDEHERAARHS
ncbi:MAG: hypothetical protein ACKVWV_06360 [Planctomycetota bacterium]